jgi:acetolactate synthase I/II/III large subunit
MTAKQHASVAAAYLSLLASRGVDRLFGNAGTDFAPLIEAFAEAADKGAAVPTPILATHENLAVTMAHGYGMISRKIPAVMVHVSVGTANMVCAAMNAGRENVAILLTAGRTPLTEVGRLGARDGYIHWAQEMYDQAGMLREIVKWEYELRSSDQLETVVDRALSIAASEPRGPVYLSLPREVLAERATPSLRPTTRLRPAAAPAPDAGAIDEAARLLATAKRPLLITCNAGREAGGFAALSAFVEQFGIPVIQHKPRYFSLPSSHPMHLGYEPKRLIGEADVILALECDVPWIPVQAVPRGTCKVIQCGLDPLYAHIPIRGFASDITVTGGTKACLAALAGTMLDGGGIAHAAARRKWADQQRKLLLSDYATVVEAAARRTPLHPAWVSRCIGEAKDERAIVVNEYTLMLEHCAIEHADCYFGSSAASGLGWGAGAALGAKLAAPDRQVIAVLGDGAYMFSNPAAVHHAACLHELPVLFIVMNNAMWGAVRHFTLAMYPEGRAVRRNDLPFTRLDKLPAFEDICKAAGGFGERVEDPEHLPDALQRALRAVTIEKRQALLNVACQI